MVLIAMLMVLTLGACSSGNGGSGEGEEDVFHVGVVQLVQHDALDKALWMP